MSDAVGARVTVRAGGQVQTRRVVTGESYLAGNSLWQHVGLGKADQDAGVIVRWPSGRVQTLRRVRAKQRLVVREEGAGR